MFFYQVFHLKKMLKTADNIGAIATITSVLATLVFCIDTINVIFVAVKVTAYRMPAKSHCKHAFYKFNSVNYY